MKILNFFYVFMIKIFLRIIALFKGKKFKYSRAIEANFKYMDMDEKIWWAYKSMIRQIEHGEKGKNLEDFFSSQNLIFNHEPGFISEHSITVTAGGDLSTSEVLTTESTTHLWNDVKNFYFSGDIVCANLESPVFSEGKPACVPAVCLSAPDLNTTPEIFEHYTDNGGGINFFSTANNHSLDQGEPGIQATLDFLDSKGYEHVGTSRTQEEQNNVPVIEKNGIKTAFLAYTFSLNAYDPIPDKEYMTNLIRLNKPDADIGLIKRHIKIARQKKADIIIMMLHWSIEFETYPIENIIRMGHKLIECGADVILGGHAHVAQPMEKYSFTDPKTGARKNGFIIYSLGELLSYNAFSRNSRLAWIIKITFSKGKINGIDNSIITGLKVLPIYTLIRKYDQYKYDYRLLDFRKTLYDIDQGKNTYNFSTKEIREIKRLERLLYEKLLPSEYKHLFDYFDTENQG